jgi:HSP20 family protein
MALIRSRRESPMSSVLSPAWQGDDVTQGLRRLWDVFERPRMAAPIGFVPPTEVKETKEAFLVSMELPGMTAENVSVMFEHGVLTIRGEKIEKVEEQEKEGEVQCYLFERSYGSFTRSFTVPTSIDQTNIVAEFQNGVLMVSLPKVPEAKGNGAKIKILEKK